MADKKLSQESALTKSTVATNDLVYVADTSASTTKSMTYQEMMQPQDNMFRIAGSSDNTKLVAFEVDGLTTATTRTITIPDVNTTMVGTGTTQTLSNKTLTAPQINMGSDATGDMYYRTSGGAFARLAIGASSYILSANSSGIPEWIVNPSAANADTTTKGVVETATQAEHIARSTVGGTSALLVVTPATLPSVLIYDGVADTGTATAYAIAPTPAITAYATYQEFSFKALNTNTTSNPTINVNSLGAKTIINPDGSILRIGQIVAGGIYTVKYDGTNMQISPSAVDFNSVVNTSGNAHTYYTHTSIIVDGAEGWSTPAGTGTSYANGFNNGTADPQTKGDLGLVGASATVFSSFTGLRLSYSFKANIVSVGATPLDTADKAIFHGVCSGSAVNQNADITNTARRFGFAHYNGFIYAVTGDNSTVTATQLASDSATTRVFTVQYTASSVTFYINGVLLATHTTSIPSDGTTSFILFSQADYASGASSHFIGPVTISALYAS